MGMIIWCGTAALACHYLIMGLLRTAPYYF